MINKDRLTKLTQKLISFDTQNPPGHELACAVFIKEQMKALGLEVKTYAFAKNRPNIVAILRGKLPRKQAEEESILMTPHFDTVPVGQGWKYDPFGGKIVGNKLYGRGASDDKGNTASCMEVMRSLVEDGIKLRKDVIMAATVDEETGSQLGIIPLLDKKILKPSLAIVMDSTEYDAIIAQKGLIHLRLQIFGKKAHGAYNWRGINAIEKMSEVICKLKKLKLPYKKHPLLRPPTINIGMISGGDKVNIVADFCEAAVDLRYLPDTHPQEILAKVKSTIETVTKKYKIIIDDLQLPYEIDAQNPLVKTYIDTARRMKTKASFKGSEGATVITFFQKYKIPAFATGFAATETAHITNEYIHVNTLYKGTQILERYIKEYDQL